MDFLPILRPNQTARLQGAQFAPPGQPVKCVATQGMPEYIKDFGSLTAGVWSTSQEDTNLELGADELGQFRMRVLDSSLKIRLSHSGVEMWRTRASRFELHTWGEPDTPSVADFLFAASEFYVWERNTPRFDLYSAEALTKTSVWFGGWRMKVVAITEAELTSPMEIWVSAWPTSAV